MFVFYSALGQWRRSRRDVNQVVGDAEDLETIAATSLLGGGTGTEPLQFLHEHYKTQ